MKNFLHYCSISVLFATLAFPNAKVPQSPRPSLSISSAELPQIPPSFDKTTDDDKATRLTPIHVYKNLKSTFDISHTKMAEWIGLKRRSYYNWANNPDSSTKSATIEKRLSNLFKLSNEMEPEHRKMIDKIAFSPIYGEPKFGEAILEGMNSDELISWYDKSYDRFEAYRLNS